MEACDAFGLAERSVPSAESQMAVCFRALERRVDRGRCGGDKGTMRGIPGGQSANESLATVQLKITPNESPVAVHMLNWSVRGADTLISTQMHFGTENRVRRVSQVIQLD